jgi:hypothetical protein
MAHCRAMQYPDSNGPELQTCQTTTHACVVDLQATTQGKTASPLALHPRALLPGQSIPHFISTSHLLRSSTDSSPLITALRV